MLRVYDTGLSGKLLRCENWCTETITEDHHQNVKLWIIIIIIIIKEQIKVT